jgi:hypothetical protein
VIRHVLPAAFVLAGALVVPLAAVPAEAAVPPIQIVKVWYDSPGKDTRSAASLNAEYVTLLNTTNKPIDLAKWIVRDETGYKYRFGTFTLKPGKKVTVRSGSGGDTTTTVGQYVWNNPGDTTTIYRASDLKKIDTCTWKKIGSGYTNC